jgi:alkylated DNA nucleotide flippase Atl1
VLSASDDPDLPWHRVVRADGSLAKGARQRALLEAEGVPFRGERGDMRAAWAPPSASASASARFEP